MEEENLEEDLSDFLCPCLIDKRQLTVIGNVIHIRTSYPQAMRKLFVRVGEKFGLSGYEVKLEDENMRVTHQWVIAETEIHRVDGE